MFNYPIILNSNTLYTKIGVTPDASAADIRDAKKEIVSGFNARKLEIQDKLGKVMAAVPNLQKSRELLKTVKKELAEAGEANKKECEAKYKKALDEVLQNEKKAALENPDFKKLEAELEEIDAKISEMGTIMLEQDTERAKYDIAIPPCALIKIIEDKPAIFVDTRTYLYNIRKSVAAFLEGEHGIECFHPSDLTRREFTADFEHNALLDQEV